MASRPNARAAERVSPQREDDARRSEPSSPAVSLRGVRVVYRRGAKQGGLVALDDTNLQIGRYEFVSLLGPSGCGKTTLLKVIGGLIGPTEGTVEIFGGSPEEALRNRMFGFVFQEPNLLPWRNAMSNAELLAEVIDRKSVDRARIAALLKAVGLEAFGESFPRQLSGGMRQRVGIVRALAFDPKILLMDEPFAAVDALTRDTLAEVLLEVWGGIRPVIFVTHSIEEAVFLSDRVVVMTTRPGRVLEEIPIDLPRPRTRDTRDTAEFTEIRRRVRQAVDRAQGNRGS
ncbi:MAG: ABC transporter ATP-binding protein [Burkholderiales bacterium]|nr:ABC transporter ATP-binding protein [Burkholderiales bacterium]